MRSLSFGYFCGPPASSCFHNMAHLVFLLVRLLD